MNKIYGCISLLKTSKSALYTAHLGFFYDNEATLVKHGEILKAVEEEIC